MLAVPPAVVVVPLASKEQVYQTVNYVVSRLRQINAPLRHVHSDTPLYVESRVGRDGSVERVDVYLATPQATLQTCCRRGKRLGRAL